MDTELIPISDLTSDPSNVRKHGNRNLGAIKASLVAFGQQKPIVVDQRNVVIAGNGTLAAAIELEWEEIAVVRTELDPSQATAFAIADNRTAELAEWDEDALARQLAGLQNDEELDHLATGFTDEEIEALIGKDLPDDPKEKEELDYKEMFTIMVECESEEQQEQCFEMLEKEGYKCRVMTL